MNEPHGFWQPVELIVELFTKEGRRNFGRFLLLLLAGAATLIAATYLLTGTGLLQILASRATIVQPVK